jgi:hypothetical protein
MSVYDLHFNKDDVSIRNILIGCLATLSDNIGWYNQIGTRVDQKKPITVPFYFSTTGSERYLQDNFLNNIDFDPEFNQAEAFYNKIPRGIVNFDGFSIDTQAIVNKYVRMQHLKQEDDGTLNTYNSEAFMVPILLDLTVEIYVDSILDQLKCSEAIIRTFYKAKTYQVDIAYTRIPCLITFPDDQTLERTVEFSFTDKKEFKVNFTLQVKAHIPVFKEGTTIFAGKKMATLYSNMYVPPLIMGPSGGGDALLQNITDSCIKGPTGTASDCRPNVIGYNPNPISATGNTGPDPLPYNQPIHEGPVWPLVDPPELPTIFPEA